MPPASTARRPVSSPPTRSRVQRSARVPRRARRDRCSTGQTSDPYRLAPAHTSCRSSGRSRQGRTQPCATDLPTFNRSKTLRGKRAGISSACALSSGLGACNQSPAPQTESASVQSPSEDPRSRRVADVDHRGVATLSAPKGRVSMTPYWGRDSPTAVSNRCLDSQLLERVRGGVVGTRSRVRLLTTSSARRQVPGGEECTIGTSNV